MPILAKLNTLSNHHTPQGIQCCGPVLPISHAADRLVSFTVTGLPADALRALYPGRLTVHLAVSFGLSTPLPVYQLRYRQKCKNVVSSTPRRPGRLFGFYPANTPRGICSAFMRSTISSNCLRVSVSLFELIAMNLHLS